MDDRFERHSFAKEIDGEIHYFAVYGNESEEIDEDFYLFLKESYQEEQDLEKKEAKHKCISLERLHEDMAKADRCCRIPVPLQSCSAENAYFTQCDKAFYETIREFMWKEIEHLSETDATILLTLQNRSDDIPNVARKLNMTERNVYHRRNQLAKMVKTKAENNLLELFKIPDIDMLRDSILEEIASLSEKDKAILQTVWGKQKAVEKLADALGVNVHTVYYHRKRIIDRIIRKCRWIQTARRAIENE